MGELEWTEVEVIDAFREGDGSVTLVIRDPDGLIAEAVGAPGTGASS